MGLNTAARLLRIGWVITASMLFASTASSQKVVMGYYPMWSSGTLPANAVRFDYLTHVAHAFAWPLADASLASYSTSADTALINSVHRAGRKVLISLGGASASTNFPGIAIDTALRHAFVANVVFYLQTNGYDGADIDWEGQSALSTAERSSEVSLLAELRSAFDAQNQSWLLTMAIGAGSWSGQFHNYDSLKLSVDWFNVMTYDFHGSWSSWAGHNAPLYAPSFDQSSGSVDLSIQYMLATRNVPASKLVLGLPFYGIEFTGAGLYKPFTAVTGFNYSDIPGKLAHNWAYLWDSLSQVPYLIPPSKTKVDSFDDSTSLTLKCNYARAKGLAGVMIWEITADVIGTTQPLMQAVGVAMSGTSSVTLDPSGPIPSDFALLPNYPNPFNPTTVIPYSVPARRGGISDNLDVCLVVYDLLGRIVATLVHEQKAPGQYSVFFDASPLSSGPYFYRLTAGSYVSTKTMLFLK